MFAKNCKCAVVLFVALAGLLTVGLAGVAQADVSTIGLWRLGEDDPGAANGGQVNATTVDAIGGLNLTKNGGDAGFVYTNSTSCPGSNLGMTFPNVLGDYYVYANLGQALGIASNTSNFGYEVWLKPTSQTRADPIWYGDIGQACAMGFYVEGTTMNAYDGGVIGAAAFTPGQWANYAFVHTYNPVTQVGTATAYVNGVAIGSTTANSPDVPHLEVGTVLLPTAYDAYNGGMDNIRFFSFSNPGDFVPTRDLTLSLAGVPEPGTLALLATGLLGLLAYAWRKRR